MSEKDLMNTEMKRTARRCVEDGSAFLKVAGFSLGHVPPSSCLFFLAVGCRGFASAAPPLHFSKYRKFQKVCFCEKVAIIAKWLPCFSKHGKALRWSLVSGPGS